MKRLLITCITMLTFATPSFASNSNDQSAENLKKAFQAILDYQKTVHEAFGDIKLTYGGEVSVVQEPTYYTITLPKILISASEKEEGQNSEEIFHIDQITINAMPDEKEGYWKTVMTLPTELKLGKNEETAFVVSFAEQRNIGLFSEKLGYFTKMDMNMSDIKFSMAGEETGVSLGGAQIFTNLEDDDEGRFSGPGHVTINNLVIAPPGEDEMIKMSEFKVDFALNDALIPTLQEYQNKFLKHADTFKALQNINPDDAEATAANGQAFIDMLLDLYNFDMDGFSFAYSAKDIKAESDDVKKTFSLGSGKIGFGFDGLKSEKGNLNIEIGYNDIKAVSIEKDLKQALPQTGKIDVKAINIPYTSLFQIFSSTASAIAQDPTSAQMAAMGIVMRLPAVLGQAETKVIFEDNGLQNDIYNLNVNGNIATDLSSIVGFGAKFNAVFEGMDALLSAMQSSVKEEEPNKGRDDFIDGLSKWKAVGQETTGPNGKPAYSFDIETTPAGQILINGQDASAVLK